MTLGDIDHQPCHLVTITRPEHLGAAGPRPGLENIEPDVEVGQYPISDTFCG